MLIAIENDIDLVKAYEFLQTPEAGALNIFVGTVRNHSKGKEVIKLVFEAYESMALSEMNKIANLAMEKWKPNKLLVIHATGEKMPGQPVVIIGVSSAHREASFEACRFIIDELKKTVPIWKKEFYKDDSVWVNAHP